MFTKFEMRTFRIVKGLVSCLEKGWVLYGDMLLLALEEHHESMFHFLFGELPVTVSDYKQPSADDRFIELKDTFNK